MGKVLHAGRVIPGSKQVFTGESETDIIAKMSDYLKRDHEIDHLITAIGQTLTKLKDKP